MSNKTMNTRSLIPQQVKWDEVGTSVEGLLIHKEWTVYQDNRRGRYLLDTKDGLRVAMGGFIIDQALEVVDDGAYIGITYLGEEGTSKGTKMKQFNIWIDEALSRQGSLPAFAEHETLGGTD